MKNISKKIVVGLSFSLLLTAGLSSCGSSKTTASNSNSSSTTSAKTTATNENTTNLTKPTTLQLDPKNNRVIRPASQEATKMPAKQPQIHISK